MKQDFKYYKYHQINQLMYNYNQYIQKHSPQFSNFNFKL